MFLSWEKITRDHTDQSGVKGKGMRFLSYTSRFTFIICHCVLINKININTFSELILVSDWFLIFLGLTLKKCKRLK